MNDEKNLKIVSAVAVIALLVVVFNAFLVTKIDSKLAIQQQFLSSLQVAGLSGGAPLGGGQDGGDEISALMAELIPRGVPDVYGEELGVTFEDPVSSLNVLAKLDGDLYKEDGLLHFADLSEEAQQRYIAVTTSISCEYCCSAKAIAFPDGRVACGCAHSAGMRGLAMYLLKNHADEFTDAQVLEELTKWKILFFPKQSLQKALQLKAENGEINPTTLNELPDMVGGC